MRFLGESLVFKFLRPSVEGYMYVSYAPFLENDSRVFFFFHVKLIVYKSPRTRLR